MLYPQFHLRAFLQSMKLQIPLLLQIRAFLHLIVPLSLKIHLSPLVHLMIPFLIKIKTFHVPRTFLLPHHLTRQHPQILHFILKLLPLHPLTLLHVKIKSLHLMILSPPLHLMVLFHLMIHSFHHMILFQVKIKAPLPLYFTIPLHLMILLSFMIPLVILLFHKILSHISNLLMNPIHPDSHLALKLLSIPLRK